jgi:hypothetical protein
MATAHALHSESWPAISLRALLASLSSAHFAEFCGRLPKPEPNQAADGLRAAGLVFLLSCPVVNFVGSSRPGFTTIYLGMFW